MLVSASDSNNEEQSMTKANANGKGLLSAGDELAALVRDFDWSATPLGDRETWPQSLKTIVRVMLTSRFAI